MPADLNIAKLMIQTSLGRRLKALVLKRGGKVLAGRWRQIAATALERSVIRIEQVVLMAGKLAERSKALLPRFKLRYTFLKDFSEQTFAEAVATVIQFDQRSYAALRGIIVERFVPGMKEMKVLLRDMEAYTKRIGKGWSVPKLYSGARTPNGREIADWMVISRHSDGKVWVMSVIESKSISNTADLISHKGEEGGQLLWDFVRAKVDGLVLEHTDNEGNVVRLVVDAKQLVIEPRPLRGGTANGLYTSFIGVTPREFTNGELRKIAAQHVDIERWPWPVDEFELMHMIRALEIELAGVDVVH